MSDRTLDRGCPWPPDRLPEGAAGLLRGGAGKLKQPPRGVVAAGAVLHQQVAVGAVGSPLSAGVVVTQPLEREVAVAVQPLEWEVAGPEQHSPQ